MFTLSRQCCRVPCSAVLLITFVYEIISLFCFFGWKYSYAYSYSLFYSYIVRRGQLHNSQPVSRLREEEEPRDIFGSALPKWSADPLWCTCYTMVSPPPACCCISPNVARGAAHAALHMDRGCNTTSPTKTDTKKSMAQFRGQVGGGGGDDC